MDEEIEKKKALRNKLIFWGVIVLSFTAPFLLTYQSSGRSFNKFIEDLSYGIIFIIGFAGVPIALVGVIIFILVSLTRKK